MKLRKSDEFVWVCLLLLSIVFFTAGVHAEDEAIINESGDHAEIVFSYTRDKTPKEYVAADITVITQEEIKKIPASNAAEVLQYVPGVYVEFNGGLGSQATASIRGSSERQVAVYQDGVPLNLLGNPIADLSYIPLSSIDRIEVYSGAASSAWGSALGGVINIITKEPDLSKPFTGNIQSSYGEFGTTRNSGTVSGGIGRFSYLVSLSHDESDGFAPHMEYRQDAAYAKLACFLGDSSRLSFVYSYDEGRHFSPTALLAGYGFWEDISQSRSYERILFETTLSDNLAWSIEGRCLEADIADHFKPPQPWSAGSDYSEWRWGISSKMRHDLKDLNHLVLGFDGDWGSYEFSAYAREFDSGNWAAYINDTFDINAFSFIAGIRYDNNLDFGSEVSPLAGLVYHFPKWDSLARFQVARGFSAPPGAWVHDPLIANPDLEAETAINYEIGAEINPAKHLKLELSLFQADVDNLIDWNDAIGKYQNIEEATRRGVTGRISTFFKIGSASDLKLSFGGSFIDVRNGDTEEVIPNIPRTLYDISASYTYQNIMNSIIGRYVFHNSSFSETHDEVFVFDYLLKMSLPSICNAYTPSIFFAVHNLTDADYVYRTVWPQPGRWVEGGAKLEF